MKGKLSPLDSIHLLLVTFDSLVSNRVIIGHFKRSVIIYYSKTKLALL